MFISLTPSLSDGERRSDWCAEEMREEPIGWRARSGRGLVWPRVDSCGRRRGRG